MWCAIFTYSHFVGNSTWLIEPWQSFLVFQEIHPSSAIFLQGTNHLLSIIHNLTSEVDFYYADIKNANQFVKLYPIVQVPRVELEFMANYLAELTLIQYSFLQFLPSLVAASVVFLARWTLNQSEHPWVWTVDCLFPFV